MPSSPILTDSIDNSVELSHPNERYERSQLVYFDDGNIVLVAEKIAFRVHKGQLAHHSDHFRRMFETIAHPSDAETFDGCPVVQMEGDRSADLEALLRTLYMFDPVSLKSPLSQLEGVLRLSAKYILEVPRKYVFDTLSVVYPDTLSKWDSRPCQFDEPIPIISLSRIASGNVLLPAAFYELCSSNTREFMDLHNSILGEDVRAYYRGKDLLWEFWAMFISREMNLKQECGHPNCDREWDGFIQAQQRRFILESILRLPMPLEQLKSYEVLLTQCGLCFEARMAAKARCRAKRNDLWDHLPNIFGLGSWDVLKNDG